MSEKDLEKEEKTAEESKETQENIDSTAKEETKSEEIKEETPEEVIVVDRGSQVTTCEIIQGQGAIDGKVKCPHPDGIIKPSFQDVQGAQQVIGSNPDTQFFVNVDIGQPTTA